MAQYEDSTTTVIQNVGASGLAQNTKDAIEAILSGTTSTSMDTYTQGQTAAEGTRIVTVSSDQQLTNDPGAPVIIMDAASAGAQVTLDTSTNNRVLVAGGGNDVITTTGSGNVTVETGGGNDNITTGSGQDFVTVTGSGSSTISTGDGVDQVVITGSGSVTVDAGDSNDLITLATDGGQATVDGGTGFDRAGLDDARGNHTFSTQGGVLVLNSTPTQLERVEVVQFNDGISVLADSASEASMARLYEVLFDREADLGGLEYWSGALDSGMSISEVASRFIDSQEFDDAYASVTNEAFLANLYQGMAGREADAGGLAYWLTQMEDNNMSKAEVALSFAYSAEAVELMGIDGNHYVIDISDMTG